MNPVMNVTFEKTFKVLQNNPPQSLLLSGHSGVGLLTIARVLAGGNIADELHPKDSKEHIDDQAGTINVETIRGLYDKTRTKYTKKQVIIIDNADRMSRGAQSAFLKLLEEPNSQIHFILTAHTPQKLLPTIRSRVQHSVVPALSAHQSSDFIASLQVSDPKKKAQLQFIAEGLPAELTRLQGDDSYFARRAEMVGDARDLLQADTFKKLLVVQKYRSSREDALQLTESALQILRRSVSAKPQSQAILQLERLLETQEQIAANHNISLQLAKFVL
jgi:DNA polymerase III delta prime subunit